LLENCYSPRKLGFLRFSFGENSSAKQIMKLKLEIVTNLKILIKVRIWTIKMKIVTTKKTTTTTTLLLGPNLSLNKFSICSNLDFA
jgi:hypothetical protein